jgi:hypothetical protein
MKILEIDSQPSMLSEKETESELFLTVYFCFLVSCKKVRNVPVKPCNIAESEMTPYPFQGMPLPRDATSVPYCDNFVNTREFRAGKELGKQLEF